jgi:prolyl-tRNA synthetase
MLDIYADVAINEAAIPVIRGRKSNNERFAGALRTYTIEAMMRDKKALQSGTSHNLGQNFARAFNIQYLDENNEQKLCWTTSWGFSTRVVGAVVMAHGDDVGLRLPPRLAPIQVVIVPIFRNDDERGPVIAASERLKNMLTAGGIRVHLDTREGVRPGFKFNDWEMRGVPVRVEIGPKDVENDVAVLARRDMPGKEAKQSIDQDAIVPVIEDLLEAVQVNLLQQAADFRDANIFDVATYDQLRQVVEAGGWARGWWGGTDDEEKRIKDETGATIRCFPFDQPGGTGRCLMSGKDAAHVALFAHAY